MLQQLLRRHRSLEKHTLVSHSYRTHIALISHSYQTHITPASHPHHHTRTTLAAISTRNPYCHTLPVCFCPWHATPPPFYHSSLAASAAITTSTTSASLNTPVPHYSLFSKFPAVAVTNTSTGLERTSAKYEMRDLM